jgi:chromosome segregation ATPase
MNREISLLKTEIKALKIQHESEVRKRTSVESQLAEKTRELDELKKRRGDAAAVVEQKRQEMERTTRKVALDNKAARIEREANTVHSNRQSIMRGGGGGGGGVRQSRVVNARASRAVQKPNIVDMITKVLAEMQRLEEQLRVADDARMQAETEMVEVAMYKQSSDDLLQAVVNDVNVKMVMLDGYVSSLDRIAQSTSDAEQKSGITDICTKLTKLKQDVQARLDSNLQAATPNDDAAAAVSKRASIMVEKVPPS